MLFIVEYHNGGSRDDDVHYPIGVYDDIQRAFEDCRIELAELRADEQNHYRNSCYLVINPVPSNRILTSEMSPILDQMKITVS